MAEASVCTLKHITVVIVIVVVMIVSNTYRVIQNLWSIDKKENLRGLMGRECCSGERGKPSEVIRLY